MRRISLQLVAIITVTLFLGAQVLGQDATGASTGSSDKKSGFGWGFLRVLTGGGKNQAQVQTAGLSAPKAAPAATTPAEPRKPESLPSVTLPYIGLAPGSDAPALEITGRDGRPFKLAEALGKPVVITFWADYVPQSDKTLQRLQDLQDGGGEVGLKVVVLALVDYGQAPDLDEMAQQERYSFVLSQGNSDIANRFRITELPAVIVLDRQGKVVLSELVNVDWTAVQTKTKELLQQPEAAPGS